MMAVGMVAQTEVPELRRAILLTYYGTNDDSIRQVSISAMTERVRQAFPGIEVREAFTSRAAANATRHRSGLFYPLFLTAMKQLERDGYNSIVVANGELIEGRATRLLERQIAELRPQFFEIKMTTPLLYSADDCRRVMQLLVDKSQVQPDEQAVFVGHGKDEAYNDVYCLADYVLQHGGNANCHVGTISGYPSLDDIKQILRQSGTRKVVLQLTLLFVAGDHAANDISVEWREALEREGFEVRLAIEGLGEVPEIQQLYVDKIGK
mgnify:CR=1 FL=1